MPVYAGETMQVSVALTDRFGKAVTPLPSSQTFQVVDEAETTVHAAEAAMTLQVHESGAASAGTDTTLTDTSKAWVVDQWRDYAVRILSGPGTGAQRRIKSNTTTTLTIDALQVVDGEPVGAWAADLDSEYDIHQAQYEASWPVPDARADEHLVVVTRSTLAGGAVRAAKKFFHVEAKAV